ncbi:MAG: GTPase ObgE [Vampirovibrionales bacterium]|nr:GTPase ObgE [Vampirovibrionales bacterium]
MKFIDNVTIEIESGTGGNGIVAWRREKYEPMGGPAGGDGGKGGDVILKASSDLNTLLEFQYQSIYSAGKGVNGRIKNQHGAMGDDLIIPVPCGTVVIDAESGDAIADLTEDGQTCLVAEGGRGGRGNARFSSSKRQAPQFCEPGEPGVHRKITLELKLIADVGLIGMPNAGKSTLISVISAAKPKIADYPFTTLIPNLGVVRGPNGQSAFLADIPGLIEGASEGQGLGHEFLRHVERTRLLLHLVDMTPADTATVDGSLSATEGAEAVWKVYESIQKELKAYSETLAVKPQWIILTKADAVLEETAEAVKALFTQRLPQDATLFVVSSVAREGLEPLVNHLFASLPSLPRLETVVTLVVDTKATDHDDSAFDVVKDGDAYHLLGGKIERLIRITDPRNPEAVHRMWNIYKAMGVYTALKAAGAREGDTVVLYGDEFVFDPNLTD